MKGDKSILRILQDFFLVKFEGNYSATDHVFNTNSKEGYGNSWKNRIHSSKKWKWSK